MPGPFSENEAGQYRAPQRAPKTCSLPLRDGRRALLEKHVPTRPAALRPGADPALAYETALKYSAHDALRAGFLPTPEDVERWENLKGSGPARGFLLTRETADLLADADPPTADPWRRRVFALPPHGEGLGGVYVDVPHGALRLGASQQLRALFAIPWTH